MKSLLPGVKENILLAKYTTFKIGGPAKYFFTAKNKEQIVKALSAAKKLNLPSFILGQGSNLLVSDKGFPGLVIKMDNKGYEIKKNVLNAESGALMKDLVRETGKKGLAGLEWAGGLPGTLGGAVRGNAGAFGGETKDSILSVEVLDKKEKVRNFSKKECRFSYRSSIFKKKNLIILSAKIRLKKGNRKEIQGIEKAHIRYRKKSHPLEFPSAGSVFKNCPIDLFPQKCQREFSEIVKTDPFPIVPVAHLISEAGLRGKRIGRAEVSKKHPNYIVNLGGAKAEDVKRLIAFVEEKIKRKFGVELETEVQLLQ